MKNYPYILSSLALLMFVNVGIANTTGSEKQTDGQMQEQEGRRKSDQGMMRPDAESATEPVDQDLTDEAEVESSDNDRVIYIPVEKVDSVKEEESVSKYNFIFYFLYKFKYDGEKAP